MNTREEKPFFPVFLDLSEKKAVVIGGGTIAERRIRTLSGFVGSITVVSPEVTKVICGFAGFHEGIVEETEGAVSESSGNGMDASCAAVTWIAKSYERNDIMNADLVLACTDDADLNNAIYTDCKDLGIPVNDCSDRNKCDFYFPSVVQRDGIVVGINGGGTDHHKVKVIRQRVEEALGCEKSLYSDRFHMKEH
jgi:precorrin-2 dehydrogenase/sirohydrochlorin ferrochelatase